MRTLRGLPQDWHEDERILTLLRDRGPMTRSELWPLVNEYQERTARPKLGWSGAAHTKGNFDKRLRILATEGLIAGDFSLTADGSWVAAAGAQAIAERRKELFERRQGRGPSSRSS